MTYLPGKSNGKMPIHTKFTDIFPCFLQQNRRLKSQKTEKEEDPKAFLCISAFSLLCLDGQNLAAVVGTASLASSVGHDGLTALGASHNAGSRQLPVGATALIAAGAGDFTLGNSHG